MTQYKNLKRLIEAAQDRQHERHHRLSGQQSPEFKRWAEQNFSQELREEMQWVYEWNQYYRRPMAQFQVDAPSGPISGELYRGTGDSLARVRLISKKTGDNGEWLDLDNGDDLLIAIDRLV